MSIAEATVSAVINFMILAGVPFLCYFVYQKWRNKRTVGEIFRRAGLQLGELRYVPIALALAAIPVVAILIWPPPVDVLTREGAAQRPFDGLGLTGTSVALACLYGFLKTGVPEEILFRGLIAGSLSRRMPLVWANLLQAAIFLAPHLLFLYVMPEMWLQLPLIFVGALVVGWLRARSESIIGPALIHAIGNTAVCLSVAIRSANGA